MNEKLKSMLEKAGASTTEYYRNLDNSDSYSKSIVNGWSEEFREQLRLEPYLRVKEMDEGTLEKFAELIVQECCEWIDGAPATESGQLLLTKSFIIVNLKGHFGVEE